MKSNEAGLNFKIAYEDAEKLDHIESVLLRRALNRIANAIGLINGKEEKERSLEEIEIFFDQVRRMKQNPKVVFSANNFEAKIVDITLPDDHHLDAEPMLKSIAKEIADKSKKQSPPPNRKKGEKLIVFSSPTRSGKSYLASAMESAANSEEFKRAVENLKKSSEDFDCDVSRECASEITVQDFVENMAELGLYPDHYKCTDEICAQEFLPEEEYILCPTCLSVLKPVFSESKDD